MRDPKGVSGSGENSPLRPQVRARPLVPGASCFVPVRSRREPHRSASSAGTAPVAPAYAWESDGVPLDASFQHDPSGFEPMPGHGLLSGPG